MDCAAVEERGGKAGDQLREGKGGPDQGRLQGQQKGSGGEQEQDLAQQGHQKRPAAAAQGLKGGAEDNAGPGEEKGEGDDPQSGGPHGQGLGARPEGGAEQGGGQQGEQQGPGQGEDGGELLAKTDRG